MAKKYGCAMRCYACQNQFFKRREFQYDNVHASTTHVSDQMEFQPRTTELAVR